MLFKSYLNLFAIAPATWVGVSGAAIANEARQSALSFILQTGTALEQTDKTFQILLGDINRDGKPDLVAIKTSYTGSKSTEVHVLSGSSNYKNFILQTGTGLSETSASQFDFLLADYDGDGKLDLIAIKKFDTGTKSTEVHILSGASNFKNFILQTGTALPETDDTFSFGVGNWDGDSKPDIFAIKKSATGTKSTEIHILRGSTDYKNFALQTGTALHETDATFDFTVGDWNADGRPDVIAIKKSKTDSKSTEIHVLSGAATFQNFVLQSATALPTTDSTFEFAVGDWNRDGKLDLFAFKKSNTGTSSTEVHVLGG